MFRHGSVMEDYPAREVLGFIVAPLALMVPVWASVMVVIVVMASCTLVARGT